MAYIGPQSIAVIASPTLSRWPISGCGRILAHSLRHTLLRLAPDSAPVLSLVPAPVPDPNSAIMVPPTPINPDFRDLHSNLRICLPVPLLLPLPVP